MSFGGSRAVGREDPDGRALGRVAARGRHGTGHGPADLGGEQEKGKRWHRTS